MLWLTNAVAEPDDGTKLLPHGELGFAGTEPAGSFCSSGDGGHVDDRRSISGEAAGRASWLGAFSAAAALTSLGADPAPGADARGEADGTVGVGAAEATWR